MLKEIKYFIFIFIICLFLFFTAKYYFSDSNKKNSYRSLTTIDKKINDDKLIFLKSISNVVKSGMNIVGVSTPEKM